MGIVGEEKEQIAPIRAPKIGFYTMPNEYQNALRTELTIIR